MHYTLDTNFVSQLLSENTTALKNLQIAMHTGHEVTLNAICYYEICRGLYLPDYQRKKRIFDALLSIHRVLHLDLAALDEAVNIYQALRPQGKLIEDADLLLAAIAIRNDAILVTHNTKHFSSIAGLSLVDWEMQT